MEEATKFSRQEISFAQAEGVEPLPTQMQPRTMTQELRAKLWAVINSFMNDSMNQSAYGKPMKGEWRYAMYQWHVNAEHRFSDEYDNYGQTQLLLAKEIIAKGDYVRVFTFLEFIIRHLDHPDHFINMINDRLAKARSAYRIVEKTVMPFTTDAEADAVQSAFQCLRHGKYHGAFTHLNNAGTYLTAGQWADSVRESVHAVEAVATLIEPSAKVLGPALVKLEKGGRLNPNLKRGISALYDYTSDEKGIRHALLEEAQSKVGEDEAVYMFGACAAFITYLTRKAAVADA